MNFISHSIDWLTDWTGRLTKWLLAYVVLATFAIVILRYFFNIGFIALQESVMYLHAAVFMLAAAYALRHDQHVRVDIFYQKYSPRKKASVNLIGTLIFLFPFCGYLLWSSWGYVANSWSLLEGSREAGGLPYVYILKTNILVLALILLLQGVSEIIKSIYIISGKSHTLETAGVTEE